MVNVTFARHFFKDEDPIGKHFGDLTKYVEALKSSASPRYAIPDATHKIPPMFFPEAQSVVYDDPLWATKIVNTSEHRGAAGLPCRDWNRKSGAFAQVSPDLGSIWRASLLK